MKEINYTFTVIEDGAVPMAAGPYSQSYFVWALVGMLVITVALLLSMYIFWYTQHRKRVAYLKKDLNEQDMPDRTRGKPFSIFHPRRLLELEEHLEESLAGRYLVL